jgi:simple sugar transport system permease protein
MAQGSGEIASAAPSRRVIYGEMVRRLMLRPEATALAAVVVLFIAFTILSPQLFPTKLTYISIMSVAAELGIVSIGVTLLMIGGHFDLSVRAALGLSSYFAVLLIRDYSVPRPWRPLQLSSSAPRLSRSTALWSCASVSTRSS